MNLIELISIYLFSITFINIFLFGFTHNFNNNKDIKLWKQFLDGFYYSTSTISSIGYGDLYPITYFGKFIIACEQGVLILISYSILEKILFKLNVEY